ncbi:hypothetical protein SAMN04487897_102837 [Paenibacillus sp. yr247]|nr:hypothetical protein SAMN04487897_102837 [Paenibacillus sp. yr247]
MGVEMDIPTERNLCESILNEVKRGRLHAESLTMLIICTLRRLKLHLWRRSRLKENKGDLRARPFDGDRLKKKQRNLQTHSGVGGFLISRNGKHRN